MQEQTEARAGLNGGGAGHGVVALRDTEAMPEAVALALPAAKRTRRRCPALDPIRADRVRYDELKRLVTLTTLSLKTISERTGVAETTLRTLIREEGWPRPDGAPKRPTLPDGSPLPRKRLARDAGDMAMVQARLIRALDRQIDKIDRRIRRKDAEVEEKDSRVLGNLARTLGALMQIGERGKPSNLAEPAYSGEDVERRLAERIKAWARGEQGY